MNTASAYPVRMDCERVFPMRAWMERWSVAAATSKDGVLEFLLRNYVTCPIACFYSFIMYLWKLTKRPYCNMYIQFDGLAWPQHLATRPAASPIREYQTDQEQVNVSNASRPDGTRNSIHPINFLYLVMDDADRPKDLRIAPSKTANTAYAIPNSSTKTRAVDKGQPVKNTRPTAARWRGVVWDGVPRCPSRQSRDAPRQKRCWRKRRSDRRYCNTETILPFYYQLS